MKSINIFIASSCELLDARRRIGSLILQLDRKYRNYGVSLKMLCWEDFDVNYNGPLGKQNEYNQQLVLNSQIFIGLFKTKCGKYTQEEVDVAEKNLDKKKQFLLLDTRGVPSNDLINFIAGHQFYGEYSSLDELSKIVVDIIEHEIKEFKGTLSNYDFSNWIRYYGVANSQELEDMISNEVRFVSDISENVFKKGCMLMSFRSLECLSDATYAIAVLKGNVSEEIFNELKIIKSHVDDEGGKIKGIGIFVQNISQEFNEEMDSWKHFPIYFTNNAEIRLYLLIQSYNYFGSPLLNITDSLEVNDEKLYVNGVYLLNLANIAAYNRSERLKYIKQDILNNNATKDDLKSFAFDILKILSDILRMSNEIDNDQLAKAIRAYLRGDFYYAKTIIDDVINCQRTLKECINDLVINEKIQEELIAELRLIVNTRLIDADIALASETYQNYIDKVSNAVEALKELAKHDTMIDDKYIVLLLNLSLTLQEAGYYKKAIEGLRTIESIYLKRFYDKRGILYSALANTYSKAGEYKNAKFYFDLLKGADFYNYKALENEAQCFLSLNLYENAYPLLQHALLQIKEEQDCFEIQLHTIDLLYEIGECYKLNPYLRESEPHQAVSWFKKAYNLVRTMKPKTNAEEEKLYYHSYFLYNAIGNFYLDVKEDYKAAIRYFMDGIEALSHLISISCIEIKKSKSVLLHNIGFAYINLQNEEMALSYYQEAANIRKELAESEGSASYYLDYAQTLVNIGAVYLSKDAEKALLYAMEAEELYDRFIPAGYVDEFQEMKITACFEKATAMHLLGRFEGTNEMAKFGDWALQHPEINYSYVIIAECKRYNIELQ